MEQKKMYKSFLQLIFNEQHRISFSNKQTSSTIKFYTWKYLRFLLTNFSSTLFYFQKKNNTGKITNKKVLRTGIFKSACIACSLRNIELLPYRANSFVSVIYVVFLRIFMCIRSLKHVHVYIYKYIYLDIVFAKS